MKTKRNILGILIGAGLLGGVLLGLAALALVPVLRRTASPPEQPAPTGTAIPVSPQAPEKPSVPVSPQIGGLSPEFDLSALDGSTFHLAETRGRPVVLNFWATWCPPCRAEMPTIQAHSELWGDDLLVVGIEVGETPPEVQAFVDDFGLTFPVLLDRDGRVARRYFVQGLPTTVVLDADGVVQARHVGAMRPEDLDAYLRMVGLER